MQEGQRPQVGDDSRPAAVEAPRLQGRPEGEWGANRPAVKVERHSSCLNDLLAAGRSVPPHGHVLRQAMCYSVII